MPWWDFLYVEDRVNMYNLRMLEGAFSLDEAQVICPPDEVLHYWLSPLLQVIKLRVQLFKTNNVIS